MAEQQSLLGEEPDVSGIVEAAAAAPEAAPELPPEAAMMGELPLGDAPAAAPEGGFDLDALLAEIEQGEAPPAQEAAPPGMSPDGMADMIRQAREAVKQSDAAEDQDLLTKRFQGIESELNRIRAERDQLASQKTRDNITSTIDHAVADEMTKLEIDPKSATGRSFLRAVSQNVMVAVAREQARTGRSDIDRSSIMQQVGTYTKLIQGLASELAAKNAAKERRAPAGGQKQPFTPSKAPGEMTDNEFDAAVMAAFKTMM